MFSQKGKQESSPQQTQVPITVQMSVHDACGLQTLIECSGFTVYRSETKRGLPSVLASEVDLKLN